MVLLDFRESHFFLSSGQKLGSLVTLFIVFCHSPWCLSLDPGPCKGEKVVGGRERKIERASMRTWLIVLNCSSAYQRGGGLSSPCDFLWLLLFPIAVTDYPPQDCLVTEVLEKEKGRKNPEDFHIAFEHQEYLFPTLKQEPIGFLSVCITVLTSGFCSLLAVVSQVRGYQKRKLINSPLIL